MIDFIPKVGMKLYIMETGNRLRYRDGVGYECEVTKVGRKYFTVEWKRQSYLSSIQFELESKGQKTDYSAAWEIYESKKHREDSVRCRGLRYIIRERLGCHSAGTIPLDVLEAIAELLKADLSQLEKVPNGY